MNRKGKVRKPLEGYKKIMYCSPATLAELRSGTQTALGGQAGAAAFPPIVAAGAYGCPDDCIGNHLYGFIQTNIAPAAAPTNVQVQPQVRNQPRRLFLTETTADTFLIDDIKVGTLSLLGTAGAISASVFVPNSNVGDFVRRVCEVSQVVTVSVTNVSGANATFASTMNAYLLG